MPDACGVSWSGTSSGDLNESEIPDPPEHSSHYLNAAETKSDSSFPVVDGDGNLRAGNVNSAWDLRGQGEGVSEECLRKLDDAFDEDVLPDSAYENSEFADPPEWESGDIVQWQANPDMVGRVTHNDTERKVLMVTLLKRNDGSWEDTGYTITAGYTDVRKMSNGEQRGRSRQMSTAYSASSDEDVNFGINVEFTQLPTDALSGGFNRHGVRENDDGSLDVRFNAMEPGVRRGIEITPEFLRSVAGGAEGRIPLQLDHSKSQLKNAGYIDPENVKFGGEFLQVQAHIPNTGSSVRDDVIADFTHDPPQVTDISISFDPGSMEVDTSGEKPQFVSGNIREFSLTPFPTGYDNGGLTPEFSAAVEQAVIDSSCEPCASPDEDTARSYLIERPHVLIRK